MSGGEISGNTANTFGGGVLVIGSSTFEMNGGIISGNTASRGGGVDVYGGTFRKQSGGIIYGDTDTIHTSGSTENTATSGNGHAVYVNSGAKQRNSTAGEDVTLDSTQSSGWD